jgi:hypothetical protein
MKNMKFEGRVTTSQKIDTKKEDVEVKEGALTISAEDGEKIKIRGPVSIVEGFGPKTPVTVTIARSQKTIKESTE